VREACLRFALGTGQQYGIWGGQTEDERRKLRRRQQQRASGSRPAGGQLSGQRLAG
jgi:WhiB family transcriptional regulator, redox-sensing transcriptional regulator